MDSKIIATIINAGSVIISEVIRNRSVKVSPLSIKDPSQLEYEQALVVTKETPQSLPEAPPVILPESSPLENKATAVPTGCIPCSIGHFATCSGLLNEAVRFYRSGGVESPEVIDRVHACLDELNALERIDLRPEMIVNLPEWEHSLAIEALNLSRSTRHVLENPNELQNIERIAADTQVKRNDIGRRWFQGKLKNLTPEDKAKIQQRVMEKLNQMQEGEEGEEKGEEEASE